MRVFLSFSLFLLFGIASFGQEPSAKPLVAPGGLIVIPPYIDYESVTNRADIAELLAELPAPADEFIVGARRSGETEIPLFDVRFNKHIWARDIRVVRDVWCLQFSFKPVRLIDVDIPNSEGRFDRKKVWYLVYNVKNLGAAEVETERKENEWKIRINGINSTLGSAVLEGDKRNLPVQEDKTTAGLPRSAPLELRQQSGLFTPQPGSSEAVRFVPHFVLATHRLVLGVAPPTDNPEAPIAEWQTETTAVAYDDRVIPLALPAIMRREGFEILPETTVSIAQKEIAPGQDLWGVAMWTDIDPRINEFSIFISGLTNAYQWGDRPKTIDEKTRNVVTYENTGKIGEGRVIKRRVLQLDWWRVGDAHSLDESQIHFGSRERKVPESVFVIQAKDRKMTAEEREKLGNAIKINNADTSSGEEIWISPAESAIYHLRRQDWLKPAFGYEWIFL